MYGFVMLQSTAGQLIVKAASYSPPYPTGRDRGAHSRRDSQSTGPPPVTPVPQRESSWVVDEGVPNAGFREGGRERRILDRISPIDLDDKARTLNIRSSLTVCNGMRLPNNTHTRTAANGRSFAVRGICLRWAGRTSPP
jgi:hypothetical protein